MTFANEYESGESSFESSPIPIRRSKLPMRRLQKRVDNRQQPSPFMAEADDEAPRSATDDEPTDWVRVRAFVRKLCQPSPEEKDTWSDVYRAVSSLPRGFSPPDLLAALPPRKYSEHICPCRSAGPRPQMTSSIIVIRPAQKTSGADILCVPDFLTKFVIAHPTDTYKQLLSELPDVFVGERRRLLALASILAERMMESFRLQGLFCPPWRRLRAVLALFQETTTSGAGGKGLPLTMGPSQPPLLVAVAGAAPTKQGPPQAVQPVQGLQQAPGLGQPTVGRDVADASTHARHETVGISSPTCPSIARSSVGGKLIPGIAGGIVGGGDGGSDVDQLMAPASPLMGHGRARATQWGARVRQHHRAKVCLVGFHCGGASSQHSDDGAGTEDD